MSYDTVYDQARRLEAEIDKLTRKTKRQHAEIAKLREAMEFIHEFRVYAMEDGDAYDEAAPAMDNALTQILEIAAKILGEADASN